MKLMNIIYLLTEQLFIFDFWLLQHYLWVSVSFLGERLIIITIVQ